MGWWLIFTHCIFLCSHLLFPALTVLRTLSLDEIVSAEVKLLVFATWLHRDFASGTTMQYVAHVKDAQRRWMGGISLEALGFRAFRLPLLFSVFKREKPPAIREKTAWTPALSQKILLTLGWARLQSCLPAFWATIPYHVFAAWLIMVMAFENLMRLAELAESCPPSTSDRMPILVAHVSFFAGDDLVPPTSNGAPDFAFLYVITHCVILMPPSKSDPGGSKDPLAMPMISAGHARWFSTAYVVWWFLFTFPVDKAFADVTPLFRSPRGFGAALQARITIPAFLKSFRGLCKQADIQYSVFGTHCFRVGALNLLAALNVPVTQIAAKGRWASDCWKVYARKNALHLLRVSTTMLMVVGAEASKLRAPTLFDADESLAPVPGCPFSRRFDSTL